MEQAREEKEREQAREEKEMEQAEEREGDEEEGGGGVKEEGEEKSERVGREDEEVHDRWAAMILGASQTTLALGRQTSNCHVGQD